MKRTRIASVVLVAMLLGTLAVSVVSRPSVSAQAVSEEAYVAKIEVVLGMLEDSVIRYGEVTSGVTVTQAVDSDWQFAVAAEAVFWQNLYWCGNTDVAAASRQGAPS